MIARLMALAAALAALHFGGAALIGQELHAANGVVHNVRAQVDSVTTSISNGVSALQTSRIAPTQGGTGG